MMKTTFRLVAELLAIPLSGAVRFFHERVDGPRVVLDLKVERWEDLQERQAMLIRLRSAAASSVVAGVLLRFRDAPGGWAFCQDMRAAVMACRKAGKTVAAALEHPGNAQMWLASACDHVFLVPMGEVELVGLGVEMTFFGEALSKLGVEADFVAVGDYKSFGEAYTRSWASEENHSAVKALVDELHDQLIEGIAAGRELPQALLQEQLNNAPLSASEALDAGLVDQLAYEDEFEQWWQDKLGEDAKLVEFGKWAWRDRLLHWVEQWGVGPATIAVLHMDGPIVFEEKQSRSVIAAREVLPQLKALREEEKVRAVVLHINSPGGMALASDLLWREVDLLQREKPVIACFEGVAASGGYYLAAPAAEIIARPGTLTGSIGVFGGKVVLGRALGRYGVFSQAITTGDNALFHSASRPFSQAQRQRMKTMMQRFYDGFVQRVAAGRRVTIEAVEPHCRGRVWTGEAALERGLVDRHGDLFEAVERARVLAGLHPGGFRRRDLLAGSQKNWLMKALAPWVRKFVPGLQLRWLEPLWPGSWVRWIPALARRNGAILALLPWEIRIR